VPALVGLGLRIRLRRRLGMIVSVAIVAVIGMVRMSGVIGMIRLGLHAVSLSLNCRSMGT
jgi:hypothetical protein